MPATAAVGASQNPITATLSSGAARPTPAGASAPGTTGRGAVVDQLDLQFSQLSNLDASQVTRTLLTSLTLATLFGKKPGDDEDTFKNLFLMLALASCLNQGSAAGVTASASSYQSDGSVAASAGAGQTGNNLNMLA